MKQQYKKSQSEIITIVSIILLVLAAFVIVWQVVEDAIEENPQFTIYKEECKNISVIIGKECNLQECNGSVYIEDVDVVYSCYDDRYKINFPCDSDVCYYEGIKIKPFEKLEIEVCKNIEKINEVCNKVEVDKIEYTNEILANDYECQRNCWNKYSEQWNKEEWNKCDEKCYWSILREETISKKEITKEWLDEKCKCDFKCDPGERLVKDKKNEFYCLREESFDNGDFNREWYRIDCKRYKCFEDYFVEVI